MNQPDLFAQEFFPDLCRLDWSRLHLHLFDLRIRKTSQLPPTRRGRFDVILAPRGSAKTTLLTLIFPIHAALYRLDFYIVIVSATMRQAAMRLANIRSALTDRPKLTRFFPADLKNLKLGSTRSIRIAETRIEAFSAGTELRGINHGPWRPTWIILDDLERSDRVRSATQRDRLTDWCREVIENLGNGYTNIDLVGTLLHPDALPARLMKRPDVTATTFASILREADRQDLWDAWRRRFHDLHNPDRLADARRFFDEHGAEMLDGSEVLWPAKEDYYDLNVMRETRGRPAFDKEKQNAPWSDAEIVFALDRVRRFRRAGDILVCDPALDAEPLGSDASRPEVRLDELRLFGFLDPALGSPGGDFAAIATVGIDAVGYVYVLDVWLERAAPSRQIERLFELHETWRYQAFGVETNAFQRLLLEPIESERKRRRARGRPWDLPIVDRRHRGDKRGRILALEPLASCGWLLFNDDLDEEFVRQIEDFPTGLHDDGPDALAAAVDLARRGVRLDLKTSPRPSRRAMGNY